MIRIQALGGLAARGDDGDEPVHHKPERTKDELEAGLAAELAHRVAEAARDVAPDLEPEMLEVDAPRVLREVVERESERFRRALSHAAHTHPTVTNRLF